MSILEQYEKQFGTPVAPAPQNQPSNEYGFLINLVMRLSGGRIKDAAQASYVLAGCAGLLFVIAIIMGVRAFSGNQRIPTKEEHRRIIDQLNGITSGTR